MPHSYFLLYMNKNKDISTGKFLRDLFNKLNIEGVQYCVLRNYESLPDEIGHDVDLMVARKSVRDFEQVLVGVNLDLGWQLVRAARRFSFYSYYIIHKNNDGFSLVPIDVWAAIHWRAVTTAYESAVLEAREKYKGFWVASHGSEAAISLFKEYLQFGKIKDKGDGKHKRRIAKLAREDPENFLDTIRPYLSKGTANFALKCAQKEDWTRLEENVRSIGKTLIWRAIKRRPIGQAIDWASFIWGHFSDKVLNPSGLFVCLIGPDGSGKTTISRGLQGDMKGLFSKVRYFHGHLGILPELKAYYNAIDRFLGWSEKKVATLQEEFFRPDTPPFSRLRSMTYVLYYAMDYFLGHVRIRRAKGYGELVIFDRYFYDYFIQQPYAKLPRWILIGILWFLPKPDIIIWLKNEPEIIHKRKPELTPSQIRQQSKECSQLISSIPNAFSVQTNDDLEVTLKNVRAIIFRFMSQRVRKRMGEIRA